MKGSSPTIEVLSTGATVSTRQSNDLLPYISKLRRFFTRLPNKVAEMSPRIMTVPFVDVECITKTMIKVDKQICTIRYTMILILEIDEHRYDIKAQRRTC